MKTKLSDVSFRSVQQLLRRFDAAAYTSIAVVFCLTVLVWMLFSSFGIRDINSWLPYHVPVSIFLSLILLILVLRSWVKMLIGGGPPRTVPERTGSRRALAGVPSNHHNGGR